MKRKYATPELAIQKFLFEDIMEDYLRTSTPEISTSPEGDVYEDFDF